MLHELNYGIHLRIEKSRHGKSRGEQGERLSCYTDGQKSLHNGLCASFRKQDSKCETRTSI